MHKVGIIGASGNAGQGAVSILKKSGDILLKIGCRHIEKLQKENPQCEVCKMDIEIEEELDQFVKDCDYVINCAGPSWKIKDRVGKSCFKNKVVYIDVAGGQSFIDDLNKNDQKKENLGVTSAGIYPGLSEIFLKWICEQNENNMEMVEETFYGNDQLSDAAIQDICMSLKDDEGDAFSYCHNGDLCKISFDTKTQMKVPGISNVIHMIPIMNRAFADVVKHYTIDRALFYMGFPKEESMTQLIHLKDVLKNQPSINRVTDEMKQLFYSHECQTCFVIVVEVQLKDTKQQHRYVLSGNTNWNYLTGSIAALTVLNMKEQVNCGIKYVHEVVDPTKIMKDLKELNLVTIKKFVKKHE